MRPAPFNAEKEVLDMLQYDVAKFVISDLETAAARERLGRDARVRRRHSLRVLIGRRLVRVGLRLAAAQG